MITLCGPDLAIIGMEEALVRFENGQVVPIRVVHLDPDQKQIIDSMLKQHPGITIYANRTCLNLDIPLRSH